MPYSNKLDSQRNKKAYYARMREAIAAKGAARHAKSPRGVKVGEAYVELTVISQAPSYKSTSGNKVSMRKMWRVQCSCGATFDTSGTRLRRGDIIMCRACACKLRPQSLKLYSNMELAFTKMIKDRARQKTPPIPVSITVDEFTSLVAKDCHYCGAAPSQRSYFGKRIPFLVNGLDRVDNAKGYSSDNVVPCCRFCNTAKSNLPVDTFLSRVAAVYRRSILEVNNKIPK
mgnify:CR=1 FL=1